MTWLAIGPCDAELVEATGAPDTREPRLEAASGPNGKEGEGGLTLPPPSHYYPEEIEGPQPS